MVSSGQEKNLVLWTRLHNRILEMKDNRKTEYLQSLRKGGHGSSITFTRIHSASNSNSVRAFNVRITKKEQVLGNFTEQYLEDLLIQNCSSTKGMAELSQLLVPK